MTDILLLLILIVLVMIWLQGNRLGKQMVKSIDKWLYRRRQHAIQKR